LLLLLLRGVSTQHAHGIHAMHLCLHVVVLCIIKVGHVVAHLVDCHVWCRGRRGGVVERHAIKVEFSKRVFHPIRQVAIIRKR